MSKPNQIEDEGPIDPDIVAQRRAAVAEAVGEIRDIEKCNGVTREALDKIQAVLIALSKKKHLFDELHFPNPEPGTRAKLYLLSEDEGGRFPLYLTVALPGGAVRPHNHDTWAVVAGLAGCEENYLYQRREGGTEPGSAKIEMTRTVRLHDGESIGLMPNDIHSVATPGDVPRRHFHMYGLSLERIPNRLAYDTETDTCDYMEINPKIVRVDHA